MHPDHVFRSGCDGCDLIDIEIRRIGCEDCARLGSFVEGRKYLLLDFHGLEHGLDDQVCVTQLLKTHGPIDQSNSAVHLGSRDSATGCSRFIILADIAQGARQDLVSDLDQSDRNPCVCKSHGDTSAHGSTSDDRHSLDHSRLGIERHSRDFPGFALGEEDVSLRS
ncbi:hypothetical protein ACVWY3_001160 [Bradyrhizobium sp. USDA 4486]